jgi:hypothetical protein
MSREIALATHGAPDHYNQTSCFSYVSISRLNIRKRFWSFGFSTLGGEPPFAAACTKVSYAQLVYFAKLDQRASVACWVEIRMLPEADVVVRRNTISVAYFHLDVEPKRVQRTPLSFSFVHVGKDGSPAVLESPLFAENLTLEDFIPLSLFVCITIAKLIT